MTIPAIVNKKWTEEDIICDLIGERTYRDATLWINENLPESLRLSHGTIFNWSLGKTAPEDSNLDKLVDFYPEGDVRRVAAEHIKALRKEVRMKAALTEKEGKKLLKAVRVVKA